MRAVIAIIGLTFLLGSCKDQNAPAGGSGFIEANEVTVSSETSGRIIRRLYDEGTVVRANDTLAVIDPSRMELDLASAEANHQTLQATLQSSRLAVSRARETEQYAQSERNRVAKLLSSGSATQKQLDQLQHELDLAVNARQTAEANVRVTEAQIDKLDADIARIKRQLQDAYLLSPASGIVTEKYVEEGEVVNPGKAMLKISSLDTVWVKVYLPAREFASVKLGEKASVATESGEKTYPGTVVWTSNEAEFTPKNVQTEKSRANLVYAVKVSIPNTDGRLKIGMPVYVSLEKS